MDFLWLSEYTAIISLNSVKELVFVMETRCIFLDLRTKLLFIIWMGFGFKELIVFVDDMNTYQLLKKPLHYWIIIIIAVTIIIMTEILNRTITFMVWHVNKLAWSPFVLSNIFLSCL
jgi:putative solute:sodium symporter small subunit